MSFVLTAAATLTIISCIMIINRYGRLDLLEAGPLFIFVFIFSHIIKAPLILIYGDDFITFSDYFPQEYTIYVIIGFVFSFIFLISFIFGYYSNAHRFIPKPKSYIFLRYHILSRYCTIMIGLGLFSFVFIIRKYVGIETLLQLQMFDREIRSDLMSSFQGNGHIFIFVTSMPIFLFLKMISDRERINRLQLRRSKLAFVYLENAILTLIVLVCMAILGSRLLFLGSMIAVYFIYSRKTRISGLKKLIFLTSTGFAGALIGLRFQMGSTSADSVNDEFGIYPLLVKIYQSYDAFDNSVTGIYNNTKFLGGLSYLEDIFFTYIPRSIFPDKPEVYGTLRLQEYALPGLYDYAGLSATFPVGVLYEAFVNFHIFGLIICPFIWGVLLKFFVISSRYNIAYFALLAFSISSMPMSVRSIGGLLVSYLFAFIFINITIFFARIKIGKS